MSRELAGIVVLGIVIFLTTCVRDGLAGEPSDAEVKALWYGRNPACSAEPTGASKTLFPGADTKTLIEQDRNAWNHFSQEQLERCATVLAQNEETRDALLALPLPMRWAVTVAFINGTSARATIDGNRIKVSGYAVTTRLPTDLFSSTDRVTEFARQALRAPHEARIVNEVESADAQAVEGHEENVLRVDVRTKINLSIKARLFLVQEKDDDAYLNLRLLETVRVAEHVDHSTKVEDLAVQILPSSIPMPGSLYLIRLEASVTPTRAVWRLTRDETLRWGVEWRAEFVLKNLRRALQSDWDKGSPLDDPRRVTRPAKGVTTP